MKRPWRTEGEQRRVVQRPCMICWTFSFSLSVSLSVCVCVCVCKVVSCLLQEGQEEVVTG